MHASAPEVPRRAPAAALAATALPALALTLAAAWRFDFLVDDAFISFRYARHLAQGHGLVWNLGESPPVEGFSNYLWVLLCAAFDRLGAAPMVASRLVSAASALALTWLVARSIAAPTATSKPAQLWSALMFAALPPIGVWATGGLETMSFALCVFACFDALTRPGGERTASVRASLWAAAAVLLRADGFVWIAIALAAAAFAQIRAGAASGERARALRPVLITAFVAAAVCASYVLWRHSYFGEWGPNTARVKVHLGLIALERGAKYVASLGLAVLSIPLALGGAVWVARRDATGLALPALLAVALASAYVALVGGDWMMMHRMLVPALPFVALAAAAWLSALSSRAAAHSAGATLVLLGLAPGFDLHLAPRALREASHFRWGQEYRSEYEVWRKGVVDIAEWIDIGRALALHTLPGESMVLGNIGAFGYFPENLVVYDTHGLTNKAPLQPASKDGRGMPGHDFKVDMGAFAALSPTYLNARIVPRSDPFGGIPGNWRETGPDGKVQPNAQARERFEFLLRELDPAQGFASDSTLLLIKHRR